MSQISELTLVQPPLILDFLERAGFCRAGFDRYLDLDRLRSEQDPKHVVPFLKLHGLAAAGAAAGFSSLLIQHDILELQRSSIDRNSSCSPPRLSGSRQLRPDRVQAVDVDFEIVGAPSLQEADGKSVNGPPQHARRKAVEKLIGFPLPPGVLQQDGLSFVNYLFQGFFQAH